MFIYCGLFKVFFMFYIRIPIPFFYAFFCFNGHISFLKGKYLFHFFIFLFFYFFFYFFIFLFISFHYFHFYFNEWQFLAFGPGRNYLQCSPIICSVSPEHKCSTIYSFGFLYTKFDIKIYISYISLKLLSNILRTLFFIPTLPFI